MKTDHVKKAATTEEVSSHPGENGSGAKKDIKHTVCRRRTESGLEKELANL